MPALDGIRAFAVLAVITYHTGVPWMHGGYYGVDVFLVLSGFLITSLLVGEYGKRGSISLSGFWVRRARRLLPALFLMLAGVALVAGMWPAVLSAPHLMADSVATILYVANWHLAWEHASYFAAVNQPSPLLHTWTLAIEEQFYLVWPLVVVAVLRWGGTLRRLLTLACAGAVASAVWMIALAPTDGSDPSRAYYGSDTRAQGLLVGAALALACAIWGPVRTNAGRRVTGAVGLAGAAGVAAMWAFVPESSGLAFHGGFLLVTLSCAAVVAAAGRVPGSAVGRVLSLAPLRYLGRISYGMYLWYWPVLLVMTGARTGLHGYALLTARLAVVTALASLSFHLVETPVRRGALAGWRGLVAAPAAALGAAGAMLAATALPSLGSAALAGGSATASSAVSVLAAASSPDDGSAAASSTGSVAGSAAVPAGIPSSGASSSAGGGPGIPAAGSAAPSGATAPNRLTSVFGSSAAPAGGSPATGHPVRILLVGDSMAGSLGVGLADVAPRYGAEVVNDGMPGCSLASGQQDRVLWYTLPPGKPCVADNPEALLSTWRDWVAATNPDVVVYLARTDLLDQQQDGQWQHVGQTTFDAWLGTRLAAAVPVLGSGGAPVVLLTSPLYATGEQSSGDSWPEDDPARVTADNDLIRGVPGVTVLDAGSLLTPDASYRSSAGGVLLRCSDGVHLTRSGGQWLGARILPDLVALGRSHSSLPVVAGRAAVGSATPAWWPKLPCDV